MLVPMYRPPDEKFPAKAEFHCVRLEYTDGAWARRGWGGRGWWKRAQGAMGAWSSQ